MVDMNNHEMQDVFEIFLKEADDFCKLHVKSKTSALVMAEVFIVKVKDLFSEGNDLNEFGYFPQM